MLYKKELDAIPPLPMPDVKQGKSYTGRHQYAVNAALTDLPRSGRVLIVDVLYWDDHSLRLRFASNGTSYAVKEHPGGTWSQKNPEYQLQMSRVTENDAVVPMVRKFLNSYGNSVMGCVGRYISEISYQKRLAAAGSKEQLMRRHFAMFPELPGNLSSWCDANVFDKYYLFFGKVEKQEKRKAWCSGCGLTFRMEKNAVHHNEQRVCPKCGRTVTCKASWYRSEIVETATVCIASNVDGQLLLRWVTADRRYMYPEFRRQYDFHSHAYNLYLKGEKIYFYKLVSAPYTYGWTWFRGKLGEECYDAAFVYSDNLREVFGEKYYNVDLQEGFTGKHAPVNFCELLNQLKNEPAAEYLFKMGLPRLASELGKFRYVPDGTNFKDLFGVGKEYVPMFRQMDVSLFEVKLIREAGCWVTPQMLQQWRDLRIPAWRMEENRSLLKKVSFTRFLNYLTKQKSLQKRTAEHCLQLWLDYIHMSRELHVELNSKTLLCPKDIKVAHDQLVEGYEAIQAARQAEQNRKRAAAEAKAEAEKARKYKAAVKELCARLTLEGYERDGLLVILPCCQEDLVREGQSLGHCVGRMGYDGSTIRGESCIIFIREKTAPDKPFYTMEYDLKTGRIRQLYGKGNKAATPAVRRFAEGYVKQIKPKQILEVKTA